MAEPTNEEDMLPTQMSQVLAVQDTNILKMTAVADAKKEHEQDENGNDLKHQGGEKATRIISSRHFKRYKAPKFLSTPKAMDKQVNKEDEAWLASRTEAQLDMLISIKKMAMERAKTIQDKRVNGIFNFKILRTIGVLLEEFVKESLKNTLSSGDVVETPMIPSKNDEERIPLEKDRECNHIKPIVKVELEEVTATDVIPVIPSDKDEERIPLEKDRECNHIKPIIKVELEEMTATDATKRKRNSSCEEDVHLKKRKKKRHHTTKAEF